jgi:hypothetical protein
MFSALTVMSNTSSKVCPAPDRFYYVNSIICICHCNHIRLQTYLQSPTKEETKQIWWKKIPESSHLDEWGVNPLTLHLEIRRWWVISLILWPLDPLRRPQEITQLEAVGALELVWTIWRRKKSLGIKASFLGHPAHSPNHCVAYDILGYQTEM